MSPENMRKPLSPAEISDVPVERLEEKAIPEEVYVVFNGLIAQNLRRGQAKVLQKDVLERLEGVGVTPEQTPRYPNSPLKPSEIIQAQMETFPEEVFIAVNGLVTERLRGQYARFTIKALKKRMEELGLDKNDIAERGWDRVGALYKEAGWDVQYHSPSMDDTYDYDPYYTFDTKGSRSW